MSTHANMSEPTNVASEIRFQKFTWLMASLPRTDPGAAAGRNMRTGAMSLRAHAPLVDGAYSLPWGQVARLLLLRAGAEAARTKSPTVQVMCTADEVQVLRLLAGVRFEVSEAKEDFTETTYLRFATVQQSEDLDQEVAGPPTDEPPTATGGNAEPDDANIRPPDDRNHELLEQASAPVAFSVTLRLSDEFHRLVSGQALPDFDAVSALGSDPFVTDLLTWVICVSASAAKSGTIRWSSLNDQLGGHDADEIFQAKVTQSLPKILAVRHHLNASTTSTHLTLRSTV